MEQDEKGRNKSERDDGSGTSRRDFLRMAGLGGVAVVGGGLLAACAPEEGGATSTTAGAAATDHHGRSDYDERSARGTGDQDRIRVASDWANRRIRRG